MAVNGVENVGNKIENVAQPEAAATRLSLEAQSGMGTVGKCALPPDASHSPEVTAMLGNVQISGADTQPAPSVGDAPKWQTTGGGGAMQAEGGSWVAAGADNSGVAYDSSSQSFTNQNQEKYSTTNQAKDSAPTQGGGADSGGWLNDLTKEDFWKNMFSGIWSLSEAARWR